MNIGTGSRHNNDLQYVTFNQDQSCFACATTTGFRIFKCEPLKERLKHDFANGGLGFIEMLFNSNYLAIVGGSERPLYPSNRVQIWEDLTKNVMLKLEFNYPVLGVRLRRDRIVVVMEKMIKVFTFTQNPTQLHIFETHSNPKGLCALCPNSDNALLAFPWNKPGTVQLIDLANADRNFINIGAHSSEIACMTLNNQGTRLATASEKGTLIRVFDTSNGELYIELRRGSNYATIHSINFSHQSTKLCVSSDRGTIHIFALDDPSLNQRSQLAMSSILASYFSSSWSFCRFSIPDYPTCICAFSSNDDYIHAVCADGYFYKFSYDLQGSFTREFSTSFLTLSENTDNNLASE
ncbi:WD repeat domain phosphoinositide-interacting protein 3 [Coccinella septempunctata]|uniref:WD repeat domain phosphoinositide-interacting protein 3 n=1 Tax=Coccinella septempunctata TaxID=41139 RepID=UPI001D08521B|nr:WD repeat domain phosphoinositide-interacting protein 3 [Coccinella septempunctata]